MNTGRLRTSTLEEFFGEDAGFFDLHSQVQLARRRSMQVDPLDDRAARLRAPDGQGAASPHMEASQRGALSIPKSQPHAQSLSTD